MNTINLSNPDLLEENFPAPKPAQTDDIKSQFEVSPEEIEVNRLQFLRERLAGLR